MSIMLVGVFLLWNLGAPAKAADAFWETKDHADWSEAEVEQMLKDSPWAITKTIAQGAILYGVGGRTGRGVRVKRSRNPKTLTFTVRWQSAPPVKQAFHRFQSSQGRGGRRNAGTALSRTEPNYILAVTDMPSFVIRQTGTTEGKLKRGSKLKVRDLGEIEASRVEIKRVGGGSALIFHFSRGVPITEDHKEVEFVMKIGHATIKRTFKPAEMTVKGELAL